jgi:hypothetical protein
MSNASTSSPPQTRSSSAAVKSSADIDFSNQPNEPSHDLVVSTASFEPRLQGAR